MELLRVEEPDVEEVIHTTLKTIFSSQEIEEIIQNLYLELEEGGFLYRIRENGDEYGFLIATPLSEDEENGNSIDLISIEDIFIKSGIQSQQIADALVTEIKKLKKQLKVPRIEIIVSQALFWLNDSLLDNGFISSDIKLEKLLPTQNNLSDVLELIHDCTPIDRIIQVLMERGEDFMADFIDTADEISELIDEGWTPVMVVVTLEPEGINIQETIKDSDQLLNWDDYSITYYY